MPAVELVLVIVGFGLLTFVGVRLGAGSHQSFSGLFVAPSLREWPRGVQEGDVPRFAVEHAEALRHSSAIVGPYEELAGDEATAQPPALVEFRVRRVEPRR